MDLQSALLLVDALIAGAVVVSFYRDSGGRKQSVTRKNLRSTDEKVLRSIDKNWTKWRFCPNTAIKPVGNTGLLPMKTISRFAAEGHTVLSIKENWPTLGLVIDLTCEPEPYSCEGTDIEYRKIAAIARTFPDVATLKVFFGIIEEFKERKPGRLIGVHCHYGFNRTGVFVCCYQHFLNVPVEDAIQRFAEARSPGIKHAYLRDDLVKYYGKEGLRDITQTLN